MKPAPKFRELGRAAQVTVVLMCLPVAGLLVVVLGLIVKVVKWAWS